MGTWVGSATAAESQRKRKERENILGVMMVLLLFNNGGATPVDEMPALGRLRGQLATGRVMVRGR